jgi:hypothetical protein
VVAKDSEGLVEHLAIPVQGDVETMPVARDIRQLDIRAGESSQDGRDAKLVHVQEVDPLRVAFYLLVNQVLDNTHACAPVN